MPKNNNNLFTFSNPESLNHLWLRGAILQKFFAWKYVYKLKKQKREENTIQDEWQNNLSDLAATNQYNTVL